MQYRQLGKTGEKVSVIGMGTWRMGRAAIKEEWLTEVNVLRKGIELGMNFIDTAESYSEGRSEELVGESIRGMRDSVFIATKVSGSHLHYNDVIKACEASLSRLKVNYIDLYQIHWPNPSVPIGETMRAMERLAKEGKIRYIGVSNFGIEEMKAAQEALTREEIVSNQVEYSIVSRSIESNILPYCEKEKITIIAYSPLARGSIPYERIPKELIQKYSMTPAQIMLNWVTFRESTIAIPKASKLKHLEENAHALDKRLTYNDYQLLCDLFKSISW